MLALVPLVTACPPDVTEIEVVPGTVALASVPSHATRFELEARLWSGPESDRKSIDAGSGVTPQWSLDPAGGGVHVAPSSGGYHAVVTVDPGTYPAGPVKVKVEAGGLSAESLLMPSVSSGQDLMELGYTDGSPPDAAIVRGVRTDADLPCTIWLAPSTVQLGTADLVRDPCVGVNSWAVALLGRSHGATMYGFGWTPSLDKVPAATLPAIYTVPVALRVFVGDGPDLAKRQDEARLYAVQEIDGAGLTLAENRAGIELHLADQQTIAPPASGDETLVANCGMGEGLTKSHDYASGVLEIYLVDNVHGDGFTCPPTNDRPMPIIYLNAGARSVNLLLHEVGHALGLTVPGSGHAEQVAGFDGSNVMAGGLVPDQGDAWRTRLTVGQVFRINADPGSWFLHAKSLVGGNPIRDPGEPRVECQCGANDPVGPCPRLVDDVAKPRHGLAPASPPRCGDLIQLPPLSAVAEPAAVLAGRRRRSDPDDCRHDFTGRHLYDKPTHFLEVENLTREGHCPSWLVVFLQGHAPVVVPDLATMLGSWSDAADLRTLTQPLKPPIPITVHVYYNSALESEPVAEIQEAQRVFGADGLAGLDLQVFSQGVSPNPCPTFPSGTYAVCHSPGGSTVTQLLGAQLGLPALTTAEQAAPAFAGNVMQSSSSGSPPTLTLGQLFRIHNKVGTVGFPDCKAVPDPCPPIETDVKP